MKPARDTLIRIFEGEWTQTTRPEMYVLPNYKTKKALKEALAAGVEVSVFAPGLSSVPQDGQTYLEGPHYPASHTWYAEATMAAGKLVRVI